ncbi:MAG: sigma-70 family RNA polymerase sigma factor [Chlorobi bacterium]|nr:sigma-70 family RNA polymerase sigma factor [Chlorobiota bacterium]
MTKEEFKNIFNHNFDAVRNYIYYRCGDTNMATDVAQDAFMKLWEKNDKIKNENIKGLLFKISSDIFISNYRRKKRELNFSLRLKQENYHQNPEDIMQFNELQKHYDNVLRLMPEKQRTVFLMHRLENLKYSEIAANLGLSQKAIEKRMKSALGFLRKNINN